MPLCKLFLNGNLIVVTHSSILDSRKKVTSTSWMIASTYLLFTNVSSCMYLLRTAQYCIVLQLVLTFPFLTNKGWLIEIYFSFVPKTISHNISPLDIAMSLFLVASINRQFLKPNKKSIYICYLFWLQPVVIKQYLTQQGFCCCNISG